MFINIISQIGNFINCSIAIISCSRLLFKNRRLVIEQMALIGVDSLPLVLFIGAFTGAIAAIQATTLFDKFNLMEIAKPFLGGSISTAVLQELTPVLTALIIAGRIGGSMAAEIGTMVVTEQVDALEVMAIDKHRFLGMPRILATLVMMPILAVFSSVVAILGAFVMVMVKFDISSQYYFISIVNYFNINELLVCLGKTALFGVMTALVSV